MEVHILIRPLADRMTVYIVCGCESADPSASWRIGDDIQYCYGIEKADP